MQENYTQLGIVSLYVKNRFLKSETNIKDF